MACWRWRWLVAVACGAALAAPAVRAADFAEIKARGVLRVLAGTNEQPEMFAFEGDRPGFERELIEGFARLHRLELTVVPVADRDDRVPALRRDEGDLLVGLVDTPERRRFVSFSAPILPAPHLVVTQAPHRVVSSLDQLRGERIGTVDGASWTFDLRDAGVPDSAVVAYPDRAAAMSALQAGDVTATIISVFNFVLVSRDIPGLQAGMKFGEPEHSAWAVRQEDVELQRALSTYLEDARRSLSWSHLVVRYFGDQALAVLGRR